MTTIPLGPCEECDETVLNIHRFDLDLVFVDSQRVMVLLHQDCNPRTDHSMTGATR